MYIVQVRYSSQCELTNIWPRNNKQWSDVLYNIWEVSEKDKILLGKTTGCCYKLKYYQTSEKDKIILGKTTGCCNKLKYYQTSEKDKIILDKTTGCYKKLKYYHTSERLCCKSRGLDLLSVLFRSTD